MKSSVIIFPGSNCDRDVAVALEKMQFKNKWFGIKKHLCLKSDLLSYLEDFLMVTIYALEQ